VRQLLELNLESSDAQVAKDAWDVLCAYGVRIAGKRLDGIMYVSNSSAPLKRLLEPAGFSDHGRALKRIPGVVVRGTMKFGEDSTRSTGIPLHMIVGEEDLTSPDRPIAQDRPW
jgi:hypothetical protein